ncbi:uncharacterized protein LOC110022874 [Phalaenopsis equestris]|uniref:uncharacterized protein LOC110022874 n=1 Tax=Phalaenopsis equestris TaxID=78828 RepID=UPI0009E6357E|nr:uncharacterized protein LOC110022874 [Phalaenopsis equestris]
MHKSAMAGANSKIILKLLIDARSHKVLFGEAGEEVIDSLLALPLGSVIKLLSPSTMPGSIGNLYQSVNSLNKTYLLANRDKSSLLEPKIFLSDLTSPLLLGTQPNAETKYYLCNNCKQKIAAKRNNLCPKCKLVMANEVTVVLPSMSDSASTGAGNEEESVGGFVKGVITYMITDNLEVTPLSAISSMILIKRFSLKKDVQLEEKVVAIGIKEGLALLKASLDSPTVLTDVFCSCIKKTNPTSSRFSI